MSRRNGRMKFAKETTHSRYIVVICRGTYLTYCIEVCQLRTWRNKQVQHTKGLKDIIWVTLIPFDTLCLKFGISYQKILRSTSAFGNFKVLLSNSNLFFLLKPVVIFADLVSLLICFSTEFCMCIWQSTIKN